MTLIQLIRENIDATYSIEQAYIFTVLNILRTNKKFSRKIDIRNNNLQDNFIYLST